MMDADVKKVWLEQRYSHSDYPTSKKHTKVNLRPTIWEFTWIYNETAMENSNEG